MVTAHISIPNLTPLEFKDGLNHWPAGMRQPDLIPMTIMQPIPPMTGYFVDVWKFKN